MGQMPAQIELEQIISLDTEVVSRNFELLREAYRQIHNDINTKEWLYFTANNKKWRSGPDPDGTDYLFQYLDSGDWQVQSNWVTKKTLYATPKGKTTVLGGFAVLLTNKTGAASVAGQLVEASTAVDDSVALAGADAEECFGVFLDSGVADGEDAWVVISGVADVAMEDNTAATHGNWVRTSITEVGYADATNAAPAGGGIPELDRHMKEIGHCIESIAAGGGGTHILARCILHFN